MIPENVIKYHSLKFNISFEKTIQLFKLLEVFLADASVKTGLVPSEEVDEVWHTFILHTKLYEEYCIRTFGALIHHNPHYPSKQNCEGGSSTIKQDEENCDSAFTNHQLSSRCDASGNEEGSNDNACDAQYSPKNQMKFEFSK